MGGFWTSCSCVQNQEAGPSGGAGISAVMLLLSGAQEAEGFMGGRGVCVGGVVVLGLAPADLK